MHNIFSTAFATGPGLQSAPVNFKTSTEISFIHSAARISPNLANGVPKEAYGVSSIGGFRIYLDITEEPSSKRTGVSGAFRMYLTFQFFALLQVHIW